MDKILRWIFWFLVLVWKMRKHQKAFFKLRRREDLIESKKLDAEVDQELKRALKFGDDGEPTALVLMADDEPGPIQERLL